MIRLRNGRAHSTRNTITATEQKIPDNFAKTDHSSIVNMRHITALGKSNIFCLTGEESFPISEKYRQTVLEKINIYMQSDV